MQQIQPVSVAEARAKALPILLAGYRRRGAARTSDERAHRAELKVARDDEFGQPPKICAL